MGLSGKEEPEMLLAISMFLRKPWAELVKRAARPRAVAAVGQGVPQAR